MDKLCELHESLAVLAQITEHNCFHLLNSKACCNLPLVLHGASNSSPEAVQGLLVLSDAFLVGDGGMITEGAYMKCYRDGVVADVVIVVAGIILQTTCYCLFEMEIFGVQQQLGTFCNPKLASEKDLPHCQIFS